jgi:DNA topoisomerase-1
MDAYCVKCRTTREISAPQQVPMANGQPAVWGTCPVCGTQLYTLGAALVTR